MERQDRLLPGKLGEDFRPVAGGYFVLVAFLE
jgi:hypothetical protein